jgi:hypothetical protein
VAAVRDDGGSIRMRATVATEAGAILGLVRGLGPRVHVVFEEGTQAQWLHDLLQPHAERLIVCNVREEMAKLTLARKLASVVLRLRKKGEFWDPSELTMQAT